MDLKKHLEYLAGSLPHRGSATQQEREAHAYCRDTLAALGCDPRTESFTTVASAYRPFILASGLLLLAWGWFLCGGMEPLALAAGLIVTISAFLELAFISNPLRLLLPKKRSQNVFAAIEPAGAIRHEIVLMSHVDSHRTPLIWHAPWTYRLYQVLTQIGILSFVGLNVVFAGALLSRDIPWHAVSAVPAFFIVVVFIMTLQAELSPYTCGANDNASGVALLLAFAQRLAKAPPAHTKVWFVFTGCEEVGAHGAFDFVRRHGRALQNAFFIVIDNVAGRDTTPRYYLQETLLLPAKYPASAVRLAEQVAQALPDCGAKPFSQRGAFTDGTPVLRAGLKCLTLVNHTADGWIPNWHHKSDTLESCDLIAMAKTKAFLIGLIQEFCHAIIAPPALLRQQGRSGPDR